MNKKIRKFALSLLIVTTFTLGTYTSTLAVSNDKFTEANMNGDEWKKWSDDWDNNYKNNYCNISLTPGENESKLNFTWNINSSQDVKAQIKICTKDKVIDNKMPDDATLYEGKVSDGYEGYKTCKVTAENLESNTKYMYSYWDGKNWSDLYEYNTKSTDKFSLMFLGDPQIGASLENISSIDNKELGKSRAEKNDGFVWKDLLQRATDKNKDISFIISAGDQANSTTSDKYCEREYSALLSNDILKSIPFAPTIGNHDKNNISYSYHFNTPSSTGLGCTTAGSDYYFRYGKVLFVNLNSNNENIDEHEKSINEAIKNNPNYNFLICIMHHDIYGAGQWHSQKDSKSKRANFAKLLEKYNFDVVLSGHDHAYARSYQIYDTTSDSNYKIQKADNGVIEDPKGILYITGNCSGGSKYYPVHPDSKSFSYLASTWQGNNPSYSIIDITDSSFSIKTYDAYKDKLIDEPYTIVKTKYIKTIDKSLLDNEIKTSNDLLNEAIIGDRDGNYSKDAVRKLKEAVDKATVLYNNDEATQEEVDNQYTDLKSSKEEFILSKVVVNKEKLKNKIEECEKLLLNAKEGTSKGNYIVGSKNIFKGAINKCKEICNSSAVSQVDVDNSLDDLSKAMDKFNLSIVSEDISNNDDDKKQEDDKKQDDDKKLDDDNNKKETLDNTNIMPFFIASLSCYIIMKRTKDNKKINYK